MKPRDPVEQLISGIWAEVLGRSGVDVRERFDVLGGDRAMLATALERIREQCELPAGALDVSTAVTVEAVAASLKRLSPQPRRWARAFFARNLDSPVAADRMALFFLHGDPSGGFHWLRAAGQLGSDQPVYFIAPHGTYDDAVPGSVEAIAAAHLRMIRTIQPAGPYLLGGHCNGAVAAYEAAQQLVSAGERVAGIVLLAPLLPRTYRRGAMGLITRAVMPIVDRAWGVARRRRRGVERLWSALRGGRTATPSPAAPGRRAIDRWAGEFFDQYSSIVQSYRPAPSVVPATILWPTDEPRRFRRPSERAWRRVLPRARIVEVPGTHLGCVIEHGTVVAREIRRALDVLSGAARTGRATG